MKKKQFQPGLADLITALEKESDLIKNGRQSELRQFAKLIEGALLQSGIAKVTFICTHNSRRSQLGQLWLKTVAIWLDIPHIFTFSGGTEATAFNPRMVSAVQRAGFSVRQLDNWDNPKYLIPVTPDDQSFDIYFSKIFSDAYNPQSGFIAVMVCSEADGACPFVSGASARVSLPYNDPKAFDDTPEEAARYDEKVRELGREMLYLGKFLKRGR